MGQAKMRAAEINKMKSLNKVFFVAVRHDAAVDGMNTRQNLLAFEAPWADRNDMPAGYTSDTLLGALGPGDDWDDKKRTDVRAIALRLISATTIEPSAGVIINIYIDTDKSTTMTVVGVSRSEAVDFSVKMADDMTKHEMKKH